MCYVQQKKRDSMQDWQRRIRFLETILHSRTRDWDEPLRCVQDRGHFRYYVSINGSQHSLRDKVQIAKLAQEYYDRRLCEAAERELRSLQNNRCHFSGTKVEDVWDKVHPGIRALAIPYWDLKDHFLQSWIQRPCQTLDPPRNGYLTSRGNRVRSKSEWLIDDMLLANNLPAKYEMELILPSGRIRYPDFTILDPFTYEEVYWEHFGMMSNPEYAEKAVMRIQEYTCNGLSDRRNIHFTFESEHHPLTRPYLESFITNRFPEAVMKTKVILKNRQIAPC